MHYGDDETQATWVGFQRHAVLVAGHADPTQLDLVVSVCMCMCFE